MQKHRCQVPIRLCMSDQCLLDIEQREKKNTVGIGVLKTTLHCLFCFVICFVRCMDNLWAINKPMVWDATPRRYLGAWYGVGCERKMPK